MTKKVRYREFAKIAKSINEIGLKANCMFRVYMYEHTLFELKQISYFIVTSPCLPFVLRCPHRLKNYAVTLAKGI